ncbi:asparagine synthase (glutamine-hydrolyzing) [Geomonas paludis]|uniref:asparagine synthase (glutamine-hydrolyzing) n=1 Tax=Geomonas paludis TaxID=2740185 RepID=A0ABY4LKG6_9BACT|nr:asparagine synthase (glutamine-hydrolyzing) [Geomonas paludis]UPU37631.1 asparagine synthase (glutamine-hydrolyzing) [Geomonas paludis]
MCGIAGVVTIDNQIPDLAQLQKMADCIAHRGPDDAGYYRSEGVGLCHRRLSIIDLSERGHQPMASDDGTLCIVYNGEIYNYLEIKKELVAKGHLFRSDSDTEVVLRAYQQWGENALTLMNGMFAFVIWDSRKKSLFAARDRVGIKPFYYYFDGSAFVFGSEIKALLRHARVPTEPDLDSIRRYLLFGNTMGEGTWYRGIKTLAPGHCLTLAGGHLRTTRYWDISYRPDYSRSFASFAEELRGLLADSVALHLRSDVPVGAYLSGGIDSSSVVSLASSMLPGGIHTFSAAFKEGGEFDERRYIGIVSQRSRTRHHEVFPEGSELPQLLPRLLWHLDEPVIGAAILPMYRVCELAAKSGVKVVNGGQGGDELFGGYPPCYVTAARNVLLQARQGKASSELLAELLFVPRYLYQGGALDRLVARLRPAPKGVSWLREGTGSRREIGAIWDAALAASPAQNPFDQMSYLSLKYFLQGLLQQEDRMSMAWSIESRVPLLDYRIIEFSGTVPSWMKVRRGVLKSLLREAVRGVVPDEVLDRTDKKGYPTPTGRWFAGPLHPFMVATLGSGRLHAEELVDPAAVAEMVALHGAGKGDYGAALWTVLNLELWMRGVDGGWKDWGIAA